MNGFCKIFIESFFDLVMLNIDHVELKGTARFAFGNNGHRLIKRIIQCLAISTEENKKVLEVQIEKLIKVIELNIETFLNTKGIFIVIAILEYSEYKEMFGMMLQRYQPLIKSLAHNSGVDVLGKILEVGN